MGTLHEHLPLIYNLVRRGLNGGPDVDDVVQDVMLRALRRTDEPGRAWLIATTVDQIAAHLARDEAAARRSVSLDEVADRPDAAFEGAALLRAELTGQRRQVMHAARWLAADDRALLPLWWLQLTGELTRADVAAALGVPVAHAGVRLQRMRDQLELSRSIVAALEAVPGCEVLGDVAADWDGTPGPFWRKRLARHVRSCPVCARAAGDLIPTDRLLLGLAVLPVPAALLGHELLVAGAEAWTTGTAAAHGLDNAAVAAGGLGQDAVAAGAHGLDGGTVAAGVKSWFSGKVVASVAAGAVAAGTAGWVVYPDTATPVVIAAPRPPGTGARPAPATGPSAATLPLGKASFESANASGRFVAPGSLRALTAGSPAPDRAAATFEVIPGLGDQACYSFRAADGRYLRHASFRLRLNPDDGTVLFRRDATFCARTGARTGEVSLESQNYVGYFLRHLGDDLWVDLSDGSPAFRADSSFAVRPPLG